MSQISEEDLNQQDDDVSSSTSEESGYDLEREIEGLPFKTGEWNRYIEEQGFRRD